MNTILRHLRRAALGAGLSDGELLDHFVGRREEAAFELLLQRHGPMVLGVCRRVLRHEADAEDAFQATFLVLLRKAASVKPPSLVGPWLCGVAYKTARKARAMTDRRRARETGACRPATTEERPAEGTDELDEALSRLPETYRVPIVLCELQGLTIKQAAAQIGCPAGTVASRLARGRALLAERLRRSGPVPAGAVGVELIAATAKLAAGAVPARITTLAEGVLKMMLLKKLKVALAVLVLGVVACGVSGPLSAQAPPAIDPTAPVTEKGPAPEPDKDAGAFIGTWTNVVKGSRILRRVTIEKKGDNWTAQTFAYADNKLAGPKMKLLLLFASIDSGERDVKPAGALLKHGFATATDKIATRHWTFRIEKGSLIVECYDIYKDKRGHRHIRCEFKKAKDAKPAAK